MLVPLGLRKCHVCAAILFVLLISHRAWSATYTFHDLYTLQLPDGCDTLSFDFATHPVAAGGVVFGRASGPSTGDSDHAILWNGSGIPIDLTPDGLQFSQAFGVNGGQQVGVGATRSVNPVHALLWNGTKQAIDLNPPGYQSSVAYHTSGGQQVGYGFNEDIGFRPLLWNGTNAAIDLQPPGFDNACFAVGTDGHDQVGNGHGTITDNNTHALLWHGTNVVTDLNPVGYTDSFATNTSGGYQVGFAIPDGDFHSHAMLWHGTNAGIDLNPAGLVQSFAVDTNGLQQVGFGANEPGPDYNFRALLWNGTNQATDLAALMPSCFDRSYAYSLDDFGNVFGLALDADNNWHAVEWTGATLAPEPTGLLLLGLSVASLARRGTRGNP